ncbi:MAG: septal ring lytic transglycosylase RlpA family protein [Bacteroidota bacterium]
MTGSGASRPAASRPGTRQGAEGGQRAIAACAVAALVASCASAPRPPAIEGEAKAPPSAPAPAPPRRGGGYYLDDGPGDGPAPDLERIPDAQPRAEPLNRFANNPYVVFGKAYVPERSVRAFRQRGLASWYGRKFHGQRTSSGEVYDMYAMTAAHPTLPIPSYARVTSLASGRSVVVRVNDRGPFWPGRVIDLSYAAAWKLGYVEQGSTMVEVDAVVPGTDVQVAAAPPPAALPAVPAAPAWPAEPAPPSDVAVTTEPGGLYVQLAAFSARENAESFRARAALELASLDRPIEIYRKDGLFRLHVGPYRSRAEAAAVAEKLKDTLDVRPHVVVR